MFVSPSTPLTFIRRELTRKEAVRTKRSLRLFREEWGGVKTLVEGLARLGLIPLPLLDHAEEETAGSKNGSKNGPKNSVGQGAGARVGKGSGRRRQRSRGWVAFSEFCLDAC